MPAANPAMHARVAADAMERLIRDLQTGRADWGHPQFVRQAAADMARLCEAAAATLQQMASAQAELSPHRQQTPAAVSELLAAGQHATTAAGRLRHASRTLL